MSLVSEEELEGRTGSAGHMDLRFRTHLYSEGLWKLRSTHLLVRYLARRGEFGKQSMSEHGTARVSEKGVETPEEYCELLFDNQLRISIDTHVPEDILEGLEQIMAADFFLWAATVGLALML